MCGFAGVLQGSTFGHDETLMEEVRLIAKQLAHRGPDDSNTWVDSSVNFAVAHQRLAILDLSPKGAQPMRSSNGRYLIPFNGEIYNHADLRTRLNSASDRPSWIGQSDTEVLLEG